MDDGESMSTYRLTAILHGQALIAVKMYQQCPFALSWRIIYVRSHRREFTTVVLT